MGPSHPCFPPITSVWVQVHITSHLEYPSWDRRTSHSYLSVLSLFSIKGFSSLSPELYTSLQAEQTARWVPRLVRRQERKWEEGDRPQGLRVGRAGFGVWETPQWSQKLLTQCLWSSQYYSKNYGCKNKQDRIPALQALTFRECGLLKRKNCQVVLLFPLAVLEAQGKTGIAFYCCFLEYETLRFHKAGPHAALEFFII